MGTGLGGGVSLGRLEGLAERTGPTIQRLEVSTDAAGTVTHLSIEIDRDHPDSHEQVGLSIFTTDGLVYDQVLDLPTLVKWYDLRDLATRAGAPLPTGLTEPGTLVRVAPYDHGRAVQSRELLALQVPLDAPLGEGRYLYAAWEAEWPTSLWNSAFVSGVGGALRRVFVTARTEIYQHGIPWRVYPVGRQDDPILDSWLGSGGAAIVWEQNGFVGIDLTADVATIPWTDLHEAVLELDAVSQADPGAQPRRLILPVSAR
jgi:hypothetical protein